MQLNVQAEPAPKAARLWSAAAASRDFREAKWSARPLDAKDPTAEMTIPPEGFVVLFAELEYEIDGLRYFLSTQLRIAGKDK
jgi:PhoPQ-activated pathogenicity-related protein